MARAKKAAGPRLPERFEEFEKRMLPPAKPIPARIIGGMTETSWSGKRMWRCPMCRATTFDVGQSKVHECKTPRRADESPPTDD